MYYIGAIEYHNKFSVVYTYVYCVLSQEMYLLYMMYINVYHIHIIYCNA